nr:EOG090X04LH [Sida crystallina]
MVETKTKNSGGKSKENDAGTTKKVDSESILSGSLNAAWYSMIFQITFRVISFSINGIFLRNVQQDVLGVLNVRLILLFTTILFVSREAFRRACMRNTRDHNWPQVINLVWMTVPSMIFWSSIFCYIWLNWLELPSEEIVDDYKFAVYLTGLGCIIESFTEPLFLFAQAFLYVKLKSFIDVDLGVTKTSLFGDYRDTKGADNDILCYTLKQLSYIFFMTLMADIFAVFVLVSSTTLTALYAPKYIIRVVAYGDVLGAVGMLLIFVVYFHCDFRKKKQLLAKKRLKETLSGDDDLLLLLPFDSLSDFLPQRIPQKSFMDAEMVLLTWGFFKQCLLKEILIEGERFIMTFFAVLTFAEQGIYDVVNNLGSLAARFLFLPIEENSNFYFSQMLPRDPSANKKPNEDVNKAADVLHKLLKGSSLLGSIILVFGFSYSHLLLHLYGGQTLTDGPGPTLMRAHCVCILLLGINGVTEAYILAAMTKEQLDSYNRFMAALIFTYLCVSLLLSRFLGGVGFIAANCANLTLRIVYSLFYIRSYNRNWVNNPVWGLVPSVAQFAAFAATFLVTAWSEVHIYPTHPMRHVTIGVSCGLSVLCTILWSEPEFYFHLKSSFRKKHEPIDAAEVSIL